MYRPEDGCPETCPNVSSPQQSILPLANMAQVWCEAPTSIDTGGTSVGTGTVVGNSVGTGSGVLGSGEGTGVLGSGVASGVCGMGVDSGNLWTVRTKPPDVLGWRVVASTV